MVVLGSLSTSKLVECDDDSRYEVRRDTGSKVTLYEFDYEDLDDALKTIYEYHCGASEGVYVDSDGLNSWSFIAAYDKDTLEDFTGLANSYRPQSSITPDEDSPTSYCDSCHRDGSSCDCIDFDDSEETEAV